MTAPIRILYLEDDASDARLVQDTLRRTGPEAQWTVVDNKDQFEAALATNSIDLILSDYHLPVFDGEQALAMSRVHRPEIPFIFLTGALGDERAVELLRSGATDYVLKDRLTRLAPAIRRAINEAEERARRRRAEVALRDSEMRFRLAQSGGRVGVWDWVGETGFTYWSDTMWALYGLKPVADRATIHELWIQSIHTEDRDRILNRISELLASSESAFQEEFRILRPDGTLRWIESTGRLERDATGTPVRMTGVSVDVTARKEAELALREANRRKDEFLALLAHELRNPLAPIRNGLEVLRVSKNDPASLEIATAMMERQVSHMAHLIDDLLDVNRINRGKILLRREDVELATILNQAADTIRPYAESLNHQLTLTIPREPIYVNADPVRLIQILVNLLDNSCKFTDPGGHISLEAELSRPQSVFVRVKDTGIGIPGANVSSIFDLFVQCDTSTERSRGGLGIGLTLVRKLVELHGGTVTAHSDGPGLGSEFVITLPLSTEHAAVQAPGPLRTEVPVRPLRILVVDDNPDVAGSMAMYLKHLNHEVRLACDGRSALQSVAEWIPEAVLLDIGMPFMNGYEVCARLRQDARMKETVIVAISGYGDDADRQRTKEVGFDFHLVKPVKLETLREILGRVAD